MRETVRGSASLVRALKGAIGSPASWILAQAPGRVNLIGEHTDYNGGHVLPLTLDCGIGVAARLHRGPYHRFTALNKGEASDVPVGTVPDVLPNHWVRYVAGMLFVLAEHGLQAGSLEMVISGDVPLGAGLSSSAALCSATGLAALAAMDRAIAGEDLALMAQAVEHRFAGVQCGIMDQMVSLLGRPGHAFLLNTDTLAYEHVPMQLEGVRLILIDSGTRRMLSDSRYNERRTECHQALEWLRQQEATRSLKALCELSDVAMLDGLSPAPLVLRALHVVTEECRVHRAVAALQRKDWRALGEVMHASHGSLHACFDVSTPAMEFLVSTAMDSRGVLGARMTGGGFGGCTINLVEKPYAATFGENIRTRYARVSDYKMRVMMLGEGLRAGIVQYADVRA